MMKKAKKQAKGTEQRIAREEFLQELKNPTPKLDESAQDILQKIRDRNSRFAKRKTKLSPYDCGSPDSAAAKMWDSLRRKAGIR